MVRNGRTDSSSCSSFERHGGLDGMCHKAPPMDRSFTIYPDSSRWARAEGRGPRNNSTHSFLTEIGATPLPCVGEHVNLGRHLRLEKSCCPCPVVTWKDPIPPVSFLPAFLPAFPSGQSGRGRRQYLLLLLRRGNGLIVVAPSLARSTSDGTPESF